MQHYDIIVAGGGFTGAAAAIAAARQGLSVLLAEESNCLGGAAATALVNPFMPFFTPVRPKAGERFTLLSRGIFEEICGELVELTTTIHGADFRYARQPLATFSEEYLKVVLNRMTRRAGVQLLFHTRVIAARTTDGKITALTLSNQSGLTEVSSDYFIDCTGDADVAVMAGFPTHLGREADSLCQPMTLCFRVGDVNLPLFYQNRALMQEKYKELQQSGEITNVRENVLVFNTISDSVIHFNTTRVVKHNPTSAAEVTEAEIIAREQVMEMLHFLRRYVPGCEHATLLQTAMHIGVRESRMIDGEYCLTQEDLLACRKFEDGIAACNYDIDIHNPEGSGTSHYYFPPNEYYTIPYRCLLPRGSKNLLVAGRCISSTHEAQASYRIMPVVCTLGEAAGVAASVAKKQGACVGEANVDEIRRLLRANGAVID
ncbi:MAG: FAD-dependent oxidoreductase [Eubacteriales bacterium]